MEKLYNEIGKRIKTIRETLGLSQEQLAEKLGISRPTISQIENGDRKISAVELMRLSEIFNLSVDAVLDLEEAPKVTLADKPAKRSAASSRMRINVPQKKLNKFKQVLLYILNKVGSKPAIGETVIYKLLYFIDFNFYEKYEEQLMGATYQKNNYGPTPIEFKSIADKMIREEQITKVENKYYNYPQTKYLPLVTPDMSTFKGNELEVIDDVLNRLSGMNAAQISEYSHNDVPWKVTEDRRKIEYESVFYRTPEYSVRKYEEDYSNDI